MAISVAQARQICTQAELDLVLQSTTRQIGNLDAKQLRAAIRRTRTVRDKWRDLANAQTRDTKVQDPGNLDRANARSAEKAQLFDEALTRFEKRLGKVDSSANGRGGAAKQPAKKVRAADHRASRAGMRTSLNEKADQLNASTSSRKAAGKAPAKAEASSATDKPSSSGKSVRKASAKKAVSKKKAPKRKSATRVSAGSKVPAGTNPPTHGLAAAAIAAGRDAGETSDKPSGADKKRNLKAKAAAKASAINRSGAPRIQGHISSQGRRNQAKRSSR